VIVVFLAAGVGMASGATTRRSDRQILTPIDHLCVVGYAMELPWKHSHQKAPAQLTQEALAAMANPLSSSASKLFTHRLTKRPDLAPSLQPYCSNGNVAPLMQAITLVQVALKQQPPSGQPDFEVPPAALADYNGRWASLIRPSRTASAVLKGYALASGLNGTGEPLPPNVPSVLNRFAFFKEDERYQATVSDGEYGGFLLLQPAARPGLIYDPHTKIGPTGVGGGYYETIGGESGSGFASCLAKADASALAKDLFLSYLEDQVLHRKPDPKEEANSATASAIKESLKTLITADCED
jgi:hypothetical protein